MGLFSSKRICSRYGQIWKTHGFPRKMIGDGVFSIFSLVTETYRRVSHMARWGLKFYFSSVLRVSVSWEDVIFFYPSEELSCWHNHRFFVLEMGDLENLIVYSLRRTNIDVENPPFEDHFLWKPYFCSIIFHIYVCLPQKISHHISAHYIPMIPCPVDSARKSLDPAPF